MKDNGESRAMISSGHEPPLGVLSGNLTKLFTRYRYKFEIVIPTIVDCQEKFGHRNRYTLLVVFPGEGHRYWVSSTLKPDKEHFSVVCHGKSCIRRIRGICSASYSARFGENRFYSVAHLPVEVVALKREDREFACWYCQRKSFVSKSSYKFMDLPRGFLMGPEVNFQKISREGSGTLQNRSMFGVTFISF